MVSFMLELIYALGNCPLDKKLKDVRASLDEVVKTKIPVPAGNITAFVQNVTSYYS
jgi:hypothetical protein